VKLENVAEVVRAGADVIVAGSAVFGHGDPAGRVRALLAEARRGAGEAEGCG